MEDNTIYYISEAAKKVQVEAHVLRYWEEELQLAIRRNEMGHRCYTGEDIECLRKIKELKEQGLQLKAIRTFLGGGGGLWPRQSVAAGQGEAVGHSAIEGEGAAVGRSAAAGQGTADMDKMRFNHNEGVEETVIAQKAKQTEEESSRKVGGSREIKGENSGQPADSVEQRVEDMVMQKAQKYMVTLSKGKEPVIETPRENLTEYTAQEDMDKTQKAARLQYLLQHMVTQAVRTANQEMCTEIKESILKELDYQFRQQEERDEEHWKKEEEHYRKIDEMIRQRHLPKEKLSGEKFPGERFSRSKKKSPINL